MSKPSETPKMIIYEPPIKKTEFYRFKKHMRQRESSNNYKAWNYIKVWSKGKIIKRYHLGYYQISEDNLKYFGYNFTPQEFIDNPDIFPPFEQDKVFRELLNYNKKILKKYIREFSNTWIRGVYITKTGILAAAHLAGAGGVIKWFKDNHVAQDLNKTTVVNYLIEFGQYRI
jgi:hypothetical protein